MAITRIKNNQITDASAGNIYLGVNAAAKLQDYSITSGKIANDLTYNSSLTITGNLTVQGNTTQIDTTNLVVEDPIIILASEQTGTAALDIGYLGERGDDQNIAMVWKEDADTFVAAFTNDLVTNTTITIASFADFKANNIVANGTFQANGTSTLVGNVEASNLEITANSVIIVNSGTTTDFNLINLSNVADPVGAQDVATKNYVDSSLSSIFTLEDDATNTTTVADGDTVQMLGTANEIDVVVGNLSVTFGLPDDVTIGNTLTVTDQVNATGNITGANLDITAGITAGTTIVATGNITGGNIDTAGQVVATGNITGGNLVTAGDVTTSTVTASSTIDATGNITGGNIITSGVVQTGTLETTGNALIGGNLVVQGNITYINIDDLRVEDPIIILGTGPNGAPLTVDDGKDRGIYMEYYTSGLGNAYMGWQNSSGNIIIANDVEFSGNDVVQVNAYGTLEVGNIYAESIVSQGNISGPFVAPGSDTQVMFNDGGLIAGDSGFTYDKTADALTLTGNITGGNIITGGQIDVTGNINGSGNVNITSGQINAATGFFTGNVDVLGNLNATIGVVYANSGIFYGDAVTGNNAAFAGVPGFTQLGSNVVMQFAGNVNSYSQINFENINTGNAASTDYIATADNGDDSTYYIDMGIAGSNHTGVHDGFFADIATNNAGYLYVVASDETGPGSSGVGNLMLGSTNGNVLTFVGNTEYSNVRSVASTEGIDITNGNLYVSSITSRTGRVTVNSGSEDVDFAVNGDTDANIFYVDAGTGTASFGNATQTTGAIVAFNNPGSILIPVGNTAQRPATGVTGMVRFNTSLDSLEFYDADSWTSAGTVFTVIDSEVFNGDGSTVAFTLGSDQTTDSCIVSINGVVQIPVVAYAVSGNVLTFTEAPLSQDVIEVREITTTTTVRSILNSVGNAGIEVSDTTNDVAFFGDLIPQSNNSQTLGSETARFAELYLSGASLILGNIILKNETGNTLAFYGPDGTTPGTLSSNNVDTTTIANGTSNVTCATSNGNVTVNVGGAGIVNFNAGGIDNLLSNGVGNIGTSTSYFNTVFAKATSAQYADLAEMYEADADIAPGTVVCFGGDKEVTTCDIANSRRVAGVVSTNPSYLMNSAMEGEHVVAVALTGRVPCRVVGTVEKGDLMVAAGGGAAMANNDAAVGTVIGKALENFSGTEGVIEVVVGRV